MAQDPLKTRLDQTKKDPTFKNKPLSTAVMPSELKNLQEQRRGSLLETFSKAKEKVASQEDETRRLSQNSLNRFAAITGVGSGAAEKAKQENMANIERGFAQTQADIGAQEAAAMDQLAAAEQDMFQNQQQLGMAKDQLQFQKDSFDKQFALMAAEFDENLKTNVLNAMIAIKEAGIDSRDRYKNLAGILSNLYGNSRITYMTGSGGGPGDSRGGAAFVPR